VHAVDERRRSALVRGAPARTAVRRRPRSATAMIALLRLCASQEGGRGGRSGEKQQNRNPEHATILHTSSARARTAHVHS
jgi:hypothetical protein